jgi:uncharacterized protein (TIGR02145 family)
MSEDSSIPEVKIGNQIWMAENLNVDYFRNGDSIPNAITSDDWRYAADNEQPAWCYYNNSHANGLKYGKLYNWYAVDDPRGLAPEGWRIPTQADFAALITFLGGAEKAINKIKFNQNWKEGNKLINYFSFDWILYFLGYNKNVFNGLPGGHRFFDGDFWSIGTLGVWWCSTLFKHYDTSAESLFCVSTFITDNFEIYKCTGVSVRCIKDDILDI